MAEAQIQRGWGPPKPGSLSACPGLGFTPAPAAFTGGTKCSGLLGPRVTPPGPPRDFSPLATGLELTESPCLGPTDLEWTCAGETEA